ncbi:hypothetical protein [Streptomyces himalayensis]|uniref:Uncharacterized protein n=1 Tax=Streptomyces himalayensis subsp. himalayensis TaxID=2756131 RepID=A0A7W0DUC7_9ACTN|nr:hypothetical protein [Streptomyces himalayensis]MBA2951427.1 hypothetical protein [Streptomyces himalayensis subsp. himalayensis]
MSEGFAGDPMHEGGSQPMAGLKGSMIGPNTQTPMQGSNSGDTDGNTVTPNVAGWNTTSLGSKPSPTSSSDSRRAH